MALSILEPPMMDGSVGKSRQRKSRRGLIDDGYHPELVEGADFEGILRIPVVPAPKRIIVPTGLVPWSKGRYAKNPSDFGCFYEKDLEFREVLLDVDGQREILDSRPGWVTPDPSLYRNMSPVLQAANVYMNRAVGYRMSCLGYYVIVNVRWGDESTYTDAVFPEPVAFLGAPRNSIVSIGTYGCSQTKRDKRYLREGLEAMLYYLAPLMVLVYGAMPGYVFDGLRSRTEFKGFPEWTARMHGRG